MTIGQPHRGNRGPGSWTPWSTERTDAFNALCALTPPLTVVEIAANLKVSTNSVRGKLYRNRIARNHPR